MQEVNERDWKLFRKKVPEWQETYFQKINKSYVELLHGDDSELIKFTALRRKIDNDARVLDGCFDMRRSKMIQDLLNLYGNELITIKDLEGFTDDLKEKLALWLDWNGLEEDSAALRRMVSEAVHEKAE